MEGKKRGSHEGQGSKRPSPWEADECDLFKCCVCLENMVSRQPRTLTCMHTFCTRCLEVVARPGLNTLMCPKCRKQTPLPREGVAGLPINSDLAKMKDHMRGLAGNASLCRMCLAGANSTVTRATHMCYTCTHKMCGSCARRHGDSPVFRSHDMVQLTNPEGTTRDRCGRHNEVVNYVCRVCYQALCVMCVHSSDHQDHEGEVEELQPAMAAIRARHSHDRRALQSMKELTNQILEKVNEDHQTIAGIARNIQKAYKQVTSWKKGIEGHQKELGKIADHLSELQGRCDISQCTRNAEVLQKVKKSEHRVTGYIKGLEMVLKTASYAFPLSIHGNGGNVEVPHCRRFYVADHVTVEEESQHLVNEEMGSCDQEAVSPGDQRPPSRAPSSSPKQFSKNHEEPSARRANGKNSHTAEGKPQQACDGEGMSRAGGSHGYDGTADREDCDSDIECLDSPTAMITIDSTPGTPMDQLDQDAGHPQGLNPCTSPYVQRMFELHPWKEYYWYDQERAYMLDDETCHILKSDRAVYMKPLDDGGIILATKGESKVLHVNPAGKVEKVIVSTKGGVHGVAPCKDTVYVCNEAMFVSRYKLADGPNWRGDVPVTQDGVVAWIAYGLEEFGFRPESISDMVVTGSRRLLVLTKPADHPGKIMEYDLATFHQRTVYKGIQNPYQLLVARIEGRLWYIVNDRVSRKVHVLGENCCKAVISGFADKQFRDPRGMTVTSTGFIIIGDYECGKVGAFHLDGTFCRFLLKEADGIRHPVGLAYSGALLWVLQEFHHPRSTFLSVFSIEERDLCRSCRCAYVVNKRGRLRKVHPCTVH